MIIVGLGNIGKSYEETHHNAILLLQPINFPFYKKKNFKHMWQSICVKVKNIILLNQQHI